MKIFIGILIILGSFIYLLINHDKSLMDTLMRKNKISWGKPTSKDLREEDWDEDAQKKKKEKEEKDTISNQP